MGKGTVCMENSFLEKLWRCPIRRWKLISIRTLCGEGNLDAEKTGVVVEDFYLRPR